VGELVEISALHQGMSANQGREEDPVIGNEWEAENAGFFGNLFGFLGSNVAHFIVSFPSSRVQQLTCLVDRVFRWTKVRKTIRN
jgi:hypothetical protein